MLWTKLFIPTLKESPQEAESVSHQLMLRAGLIRMLMAGVYSYLPLGLRVLNNIENIIRQEMGSCGASELLLPALHPLELWSRTGRDKDIGEVMFRFQDRRNRKVCLGPTHEEVITELVANHVSSYKQLPLVLYQIQTKFRDEIRPRFGIVRACEFIMKDAYSFDRDQKGLDINYQAMHDAYLRIFSRCGLDILTVEADSGVMGGKVSHEFMVPAASGEDIVLYCPDCKVAKPFKEEITSCRHCKSGLNKVNTIEIGHIFQLGVKYSSALGANFLNENGKLNPIIMGCYGIGVSRLIAAIIEQNNDKDGIIWPAEVSPFKAIVLPLDVNDKTIMDKARSCYAGLLKAGIDVMMDDRDERAGVKFKDADLIGIPIIIVFGQKSLKEGKVEIKLRRDKKDLLIDEPVIIDKIKELS
ncbi:MAG: proline--tRNA ligase [Candidatus Omnitrophota bacterium]|jgi:prolyl-tRNA synthetase|nr:MAG: proline--tRNA ligase [Candidatus Omnitrophota bacterium]